MAAHREAVSYKQGHYGRVCPKHPELNGLRQRVSRTCVGCRRDASKVRYRAVQENPYTCLHWQSHPSTERHRRYPGPGQCPFCHVPLVRSAQASKTRPEEKAGGRHVCPTCEGLGWVPGEARTMPARPRAHTRAKKTKCPPDATSEVSER